MYKVIFVDELKHPVSHVDLGWTQDEYNNFLIDVWSIYKKDFEATDIKAAAGEPISFTITKEWFK